MIELNRDSSRVIRVLVRKNKQSNFSGWMETIHIWYLYGIRILPLLFFKFLAVKNIEKVMDTIRILRRYCMQIFNFHLFFNLSKYGYILWIWMDTRRFHLFYRILCDTMWKLWDFWKVLSHWIKMPCDESFPSFFFLSHWIRIPCDTVLFRWIRMSCHIMWKR